jgi:predicted  nucleic acid-binding Zn-ribbon protein
MTRDSEREQAVRAAREHVERTRLRIADGRATIERLQESIEDTNRHIESISVWIDETERALSEERRHRPAAS